MPSEYCTYSTVCLGGGCVPAVGNSFKPSGSPCKTGWGKSGFCGDLYKCVECEVDQQCQNSPSICQEGKCEGGKCAYDWPAPKGMTCDDGDPCSTKDGCGYGQSWLQCGGMNFAAIGTSCNAGKGSCLAGSLGIETFCGNCTEDLQCLPTQKCTQGVCK